MKKYSFIITLCLTLGLFVLIPKETQASFGFSASVSPDVIENIKTDNDATKLNLKYSITAASGTTQTKNITVFKKNNPTEVGTTSSVSTTYVKLYDEVGWGLNGSAPYHRKAFYEQIGTNQITKRNSAFVMLYNAVPRQVDKPNELVKGTLVSWQEIPLKIDTVLNQGNLVFDSLVKDRNYIPEILVVNTGYGSNLVVTGSPIKSTNSVGGGNTSNEDPFVQASIKTKTVSNVTQYNICVEINKYAKADKPIKITRGTIVDGILVPSTPLSVVTVTDQVPETRYTDTAARRLLDCTAPQALLPNTSYVADFDFLITDDEALELNPQTRPFSVRVLVKTYANGLGADISRVLPSNQSGGNNNPGNQNPSIGNSPNLIASKLNDGTYNACGYVDQADKLSDINISLTMGTLSQTGNSTPVITPDYDNRTITKSKSFIDEKINQSTKRGTYCANFGEFLPGNYVFKMTVSYKELPSVTEYRSLIIGGLNPNRVPIADPSIGIVWSKKNNAFVVSGKITNLPPNDGGTVALVKKGTFTEIVPLQTDMDGYATPQREFIITAKFRNLASGVYTAIIRPLRANGTPFMTPQGRIERVSEEFETENIKKISPDDTVGVGEGDTGSGGSTSSGGGLFDSIGGDLLSIPKDGLVLCGRPGQPVCDFNMLVITVNKFINFALTLIATPIMLFMLFKTAWEFFTAGGSTEQIKRAKQRLLAIVIGYVIALTAWLVIKTIIILLVGEDNITGSNPIFKTFFN